MSEMLRLPVWNNTSFKGDDDTGSKTWIIDTSRIVAVKLEYVPKPTIFEQKHQVSVFLKPPNERGDNYLYKDTFETASEAEEFVEILLGKRQQTWEDRECQSLAGRQTADGKTIAESKTGEHHLKTGVAT